MKKTFSAIHPLLGTKKNPSAQHLLERSVYFWWWAYLKRNDEYIKYCSNQNKSKSQKLQKIFEDFGDVRSNDFRKWWGGKEERGSNLFGENRSELTVTKINSFNDFEINKKESTLILAINLEIGKRKLQAMISKILTSEHQGRRGRKALRSFESTACYPLHRNFSVYNLKRMLMVYDAVKENELRSKAEKKSLWQIGESLKLVPSAMPNKYDNKYDTRNNHNTMTMTVSRYYRSAINIIANTSLGQFPKSDKKY